ncbi:secreted protein [Melampsora americana]|nr:secreted protein [Melampsora americana]
MINFIPLVIFYQLFIIFGQANSHFGLAERSSEDVAHNTVLEKRQSWQNFQSSRTNGPNAGGNPIIVNCFISNKYPNVTGNALDCFAAINYLYSGNSRSARGCAICHSCAVMPLDGSYTPIGTGARIPRLPQADVNAAYDSWFTPGQVTATASKPCDPGYVTPPGLQLGRLPTPKTFYATMLLGTNGGACNACSDDLANEIFKNAN